MAIASWLTLATKSGTGNKTVDLTASKNTGASRTTIVTVSVSGITKTINCTQTEADKFTINISALTTNSLGTIITNIGDCSIGSFATGGVKEGTYYRDTQVTLTAKAAPPGHDFVGWYEDSNLVSTSLSFDVTLTANRILVAKYKSKSYTVNATSEDTNKGTVSPASQTVEHGANATVVATPKAAYNFEGWYNGTTKLSSNASYTFAVISDNSLTAKFTIKTFTTTTANSTGGTANVNMSSVEYGGSAIWTATPNTGYEFSEWSSGSAINPMAIVNITADTHITPVFVRKSYTVTWNGNGGTPSESSSLFYYNDVLGTLPIPTRTGYTLMGWSTSASGPVDVSSITTHVTDNVTYYAIWQINSYTLTVTAGTGGTVSGGGTYNYGATATLKATPSAGYHFVKWSDGNTNANRTVTVTGNATYTATFEQDPYLNLDNTSLTFEAAGGTQTVKVTSNVNWTVS